MRIIAYDITKAPIAEQKEKAKQAANMEVFQGASSFEEEPSAAEKDSRTILDEAGYPEQEITEVLAFFSPPFPKLFGRVTLSIKGTRRFPRIMA